MVKHRTKCFNNMTADNPGFTVTCFNLKSLAYLYYCHMAKSQNPGAQTVPQNSQAR